ncbi:MAG: MFS transporter [Pseudomonadota bacterium]
MQITRRDVLNWSAPISAMAVVSVGLSMSVPLFALLMERQGASGAEIGLNHTMAAVAMVASAPLLPRILARTGIVPLMLVSVAALAVVFLVIPLWSSQIWWGALRLVFGTAATALFFTSEFWLMSTAPDELRGRLVGIYAVVLSASYMVGPLMLTATGVNGALTFIAPAAFVLISSLPIVLGRREAPPSRSEERAPVLAILTFFRSDPMVLWAVVLFGVIEFGAMGLISVWAMRTGYEETTAVQMVFWLAFGSLAFQLPMGWAADRFDRRKLLVAAAIVSVVMPFVVIEFGANPSLAAAAIFVWGGMAVAFYSLGLTELGARYRGEMLARGNAALVLAYGIGALVSPGAFGVAMDAIPPDGVLWAAAAAALAYLMLAIVRLRRRRPAGVDSSGEMGR